MPTYEERVKAAMAKATNAAAQGATIAGATGTIGNKTATGGVAGVAAAAAAPKSTTSYTPPASSATTGGGIGNGGADYNSLDTAKKKAMELDAARVKNDPAYRDSEIKRTLAAIEQRRAQGLDTSAQEKYLNVNLGYNGRESNGLGAITPPSAGAQTNTPSPAPATPPLAQTGNETARNYIQELADARRQQTIAALEKSRQEALLNLQGEKSAIAPVYYDKRNQVAAGSQQQARNFAEFMAARGGTNSGANAQAELSRNMVTQGNLGALGRQEAAAFQDIERRTTGVNNSYASDKAAAEAGIQGDQLNLMLQDYYRAQERGDRLTQLAIENEFQRAGLTGYLNGQRTLAGQGLDLDREFGYADRLGYLGGNRTLQGQQFDRSIYESDRDFNYQTGRDNVADTQWQQQFDEDRRRYGEEFAYQKARDAISDERYKLEFDEDKRRYGLNYALDKAMQNAQIKNMQADNARMAANQSSGGSSTKYNYETDPQFAEEIAWINGNQAGAYEEVQASAQELIAKFGYDGYLALLKAATPKG